MGEGRWVCWMLETRWGWLEGWVEGTQTAVCLGKAFNPAFYLRWLLDGGLFGGGVWWCSAVNVASKANLFLEKGWRGSYTTERTDGAGILRWTELNQGACGVLRCSVVKRRNGAGVYR